MTSTDKDNESMYALRWLHDNTKWVAASIEGKDEKGLTAIHWACHRGAPLSIIMILLKELDERTIFSIDNNRHTSLHAALYVEEPNLEIISELVRAFGKEKFDELNIASGGRLMKKMVNILKFSEWTPGGGKKNRGVDFPTFKIACRLQIITTELTQTFLKAYELPFEDFFLDDEKFEIIDHLHSTFLFAETKYCAEFDQIVTIREKLLAKEMVDAIGDKEDGEPIRRGRITILGQGRAGKTSTVKNLRQEPFEGALRSTPGVDVSDANVNSIGAEISNSQFVETAGGWRVGVDDVPNKPQSYVRELSQRGISGRFSARSSLLTRQSISSSGSLSNFSSSSSSFRHLRRLGSTLFKKKIRNSHETVVDDGDGNPIQVSIFDYGGQPIFQNLHVQQLCMPRKSSYVLVFNVQDLIVAEKKDNALHHIRFWLRSLRKHAVPTYNSVDVTDLSLRHPPLILVGTHYDEIKKHKRKATRMLNDVNEILLKEFGYLKIFQTSKDDNTLKGRGHLYNQDQDLCFWPVDNTDPDDENIVKLRQVLVVSIVKDPLDYINVHVPLTWKKLIKSLVGLSDEIPALKIQADDEENKPSIVKLMKNFDALSDIDMNDKLSCRRRGLAFVKFCAEIGTLFSFDSIPGLQGYCVLDRQWILDTITYVVRDFQLHRFRRDYNAMNLNRGIPWTNLLTKGVANLPLLRKLWLGESDSHIEFLINLMVHLGVFGILPSTDHMDEYRRFLVPAMITDHMNSGKFSESKILEHLGLSSVDEAFRTSFKFDEDFIPAAYYNRVVARLVTVWRDSYVDEDPTVLPNGCLLCIGSVHLVLVLNLSNDKFEVDVLASTRDESDIVVPLVATAMSHINYEMYCGHLHFGQSKQARKFVESGLENAMSTEDCNTKNEVQEDTDHVHGNGFIVGTSPFNKDLETEYHEDKKYAKLKKKSTIRGVNTSLVENRETDAIERFKSFFMKYNISEAKAESFAIKIADIDPDLLPDNLKQIYVEETESTFRKDILHDWMGVKNPIDQRLIEKALKDCPAPLPKEDYLIGYFDEDSELDHVKKEKEVISRRLAPANLSTITARMGAIDVLRRTAGNKSKVLHLAMHGNLPTGRDRVPTLAFRRDNGSIVNAEDLTTALALCCNGEGINTKGNTGTIECVFFNACTSHGLAKLLKERYGVHWILSWETEVNDEAAMCFAEAFYHFLGVSRENCEKFEDAYKRAYAELKLRGWVMIDPQNRGLLSKIQNDECNMKLKAAGIPHLYTSTEHLQSDTTYRNEANKMDSKCSCIIT